MSSVRSLRSLLDALKRLATRPDELALVLPDAWAKTRPESVRAYRGRGPEAQATAKRESHKPRRAMEPVQGRLR
jgi:hypothetical protein